MKRANFSDLAAKRPAPFLAADDNSMIYEVDGRQQHPSINNTLSFMIQRCDVDENWYAKRPLRGTA
jgi:hypothetical protein